MSQQASHHAFRDVPYMGVIYVVTEAVKLGFTNGHPDWCNLGQGQPEVGDMPGAPKRSWAIEPEPSDHAYGPVGGTDAFRDLVADHYNRLYRRGAASRYTRDNVAVAAGGRLAIARVLAALGRINIGYQTPDYTAYEDLLAYNSGRLAAVVLPTSEQDAFRISPERLQAAIDTRGLQAFLFSNPCNPTGQLITGGELERYCESARHADCTLISDEFYSHFIYTAAGEAAEGPVSAAACVEDVDKDPVVIIDGLTKSYRYPGWRIGWVLGTPDIIDTINAVASAIDGGPSTLVQRAAMQALEPSRADQETTALRAHFTRKRNLMLEKLEQMGIRCPCPPRGTFYVWADISALPGRLSNADHFFRAALERKVMIVPGRFFDVNPDGARTADARYDSWVRFSFGPPIDNVAMGLERLQQLIEDESKRL